MTVEEWSRYTELMKGERGMWSPNLNPLTALGIEARTAEEREKYARMLAKKYYERVSKELDFDKVYRQEFEKLYPNELPFEVEPHISQSVGRVVYFTRFDNCDSCKSDLGKSSLTQIIKHLSIFILLGKTSPIMIFVNGLPTIILTQ